MRKRLVLSSALLAAAVLAVAPRALAAEADPWAGENDETREKMEELADEEITGQLDDDDREVLHKYWASHLHRCPMDGVDSARYSIAELKLQRGDPKAAAAALLEVAANTTNPEVRGLTHLNLGELYRRHLNDADAAVKEFLLVTGLLRHRARHYMLRMFDETGKAEEAAKAVDLILPQVKEKGEKLALLHQLAALYKRLNRADEALAVYERITREFTPADAKEMREAVQREVREAFDKMIALRQREEGDAAEQIEEQLELRQRELRLARRFDELKAFEEAAAQGEERLRKLNAQQEEKEQKENKEERRGPTEL